MSAAQVWSGAVAWKFWSSTFGAGCFDGSVTVVVGLNFFETLLFKPISLMAFATVLRQADSRSESFCNVLAIL